MQRKVLGFSYFLMLLILVSCQVKEGDLQDQSEIPVTIVILGSSTAAGTGPPCPDWYQLNPMPMHGPSKKGIASYAFILSCGLSKRR